jgi:hypothetical protein
MQKKPLVKFNIPSWDDKIQHPEETRSRRNMKEEVKLSLFADDMILYLKDPKESTRKLLGLINILANTFSDSMKYPSKFQ